MLNIWYNRVTENPNDLSPLVDAVVWFENELISAKQEIKLNGSYEKQSSELPGIMEYRFSQLQEVEAIIEYLEKRKEKLFISSYKKYLENYNKTLSSKDAERYANGDNDVYEISMLIIRINLLRNTYLGITKGLESKSFQLNNLVKLKVACMEDYWIKG